MKTNAPLSQERVFQSFHDATPQALQLLSIRNCLRSLAKLSVYVGYADVDSLHRKLVMKSLRGSLLLYCYSKDRDNEILSALKDFNAKEALRILVPTVACVTSSDSMKIKRNAISVANTFLKDFNSASSLNIIGADLTASRLRSTTIESVGRHIWYGSGSAEHQELIQKLSKHENWSFWERWLSGEGTTGQRALQFLKKVALISDQDWNQGPAHIAAKIREIEAQLLGEQSHLAETLEYDPETDKVHVHHIPVQEPAHVDALLDAVEDTLEIACLKPNSPSPDEGIYASLHVMLDRRRDKPQSIEITCSRAASELRRMIDIGDLPNDSNQTGLLSAVEELGRGVRAHHPDVAAYRNRMVEQSIGEMNKSDCEQLFALQELVEQVGDDDFIEETQEDVVALTADRSFTLQGHAPRVGPVDAAARLAHRAVGLQDIIRELCQKGSKVFDSPEVKTLRLLGLGAAVVTTSIAIFVAMFGIL